MLDYRILMFDDEGQGKLQLTIDVYLASYENFAGSINLHLQGNRILISRLSLTRHSRTSGNPNPLNLNVDTATPTRHSVAPTRHSRAGGNPNPGVLGAVELSGHDADAGRFHFGSPQVVACKGRRGFGFPPARE